MADDRSGDMAIVSGLLRAHFATDIGDVCPLSGGFFSNAFAFTANGQRYVVRLNSAAHAAEGFAKDAYAARHFASPDLPIPRIVATGTLGERHYAISERVTGRTLDAHTPEERRAVLPSILDTVDAIGRADTSASHGYGLWGSDGQGRFDSWRAYLSAIIENEHESYYQNWHALFTESFLERDIYATVYRRMLELAEHCPEERGLIHNDYWFENILADRGHITGVIDWANALYGDPLYDIARLSWGAAWPDWWF